MSRLTAPAQTEYQACVYVCVCLTPSYISALAWGLGMLRRDERMITGKVGGRVWAVSTDL